VCPVAFRQENVVPERLRAEGVHQEGTVVGRWCVELRQIGARTVAQMRIQKR
jgi:hypothetical protein